MKSSSRLGGVVVLVLAVGTLLAGCSMSRSTRGIEPCDLLTESELSGLGDFGEPSRQPRSRTTACTWHSLDSGSDVTVRPQVNIEVRHNTRFPKNAESESPDLRVGKTQTTGRRFVEEQLDNSCLITLYYNRKGSVNVSATSPDPKGHCAMAHRVAETIDPKLS